MSGLKKPFGQQTLELSTMNQTESKHYNMKMFINATRDYCNNRTEETANILNRHLQILSVTIDLSIFDPHTSVACEFFVSLHELLTTLEPRSPLAWCCVSVLSTCCRNYAAREALIKTYQFLPLLSRLLGDHLSTEKKIRLLSLMQELTCGIKILWQIPHLTHLMTTLTKWINSGLKDIMCLSLGVLVNLCYKNLPALYTLSRCVDIKEFMRRLMCLEDSNLEVHICKLLIICDNLHGKVPKESLLQLTSVTFKSLCKAFTEKDVILLRHTVEFFLDIKIESEEVNFLLSYEQYEQEVEKLLKTVENNILSSGDATNSEPECIKLILQFLTALINQKLPKTENFYDRIAKIALQFLPNEMVSSQAFLTLRAITLHSKNPNPKILELMLPKLSVFLVELEMSTEETPRNLEYNKKLSSLMELLASFVKSVELRENIMKCVKEQHLRKIFMPLLGDFSMEKKQSDFYSLEMITLFANALFLVTRMAEFDEGWLQMRKELFNNKEIHVILAQAMYNTSEQVRIQILDLISLPAFPREDLAKALTMIQSTLVGQNNISTFMQKHISSAQQFMDNFAFPRTYAGQAEEIDQIINKFRETIVQNDLSNMATSEVMKLYEYKLATMAHAERVAMGSMEAASQRCTHLEHRIAQLTAELSRTTQLLFHAQQCKEEATKEKNTTSERLKDMGVRLDAAKGRVKVLTSQLQSKENALKENTIALEETSKKLRVVEGEKKILEEEYDVCKTYQQALKENLMKKEKAYEKTKENLASTLSELSNLKSRLFDAEQQLLQKEAQLVQCRQDLDELKVEYKKKKRILDSIMELTTATPNKNQSS